MHFLAAVFTALFSFCHASSIRQSMARPVMFSPDQQPGIAQYVPTHREAMHVQAVYAERGCVSCQKTNAVYIVRSN